MCYTGRLIILKVIFDEIWKDKESLYFHLLQMSVQKSLADIESLLLFPMEVQKKAKYSTSAP